jgi:hypothetical protein
MDHKTAAKAHEDAADCFDQAADCFASGQPEDGHATIAQAKTKSSAAHDMSSNLRKSSVARKPLTFDFLPSEGDDADAMAQLAKIAGTTESDKVDPMTALELIAKQAETGNPRPGKPNGSTFAELGALYKLN